MTRSEKKSSALLWVGILGGGCLLLVVCGGILASIAIPSFISYVRKAKAAEAQAQLAQLARQVEAFCDEQGRLPGPAGPVPPFPGPEKQVGDFGADPVFAELGFTPYDPVYYSYSIRPGALGAVTLVAAGDLDGDGMRGEQTWTCRLDGCDCSEDFTLDSELLE